MARRGPNGTPRGELAKLTAERLQLQSADEVERVVEELLGVIAGELNGGRNVTLQNFGTFKIRLRGARVCPDGKGGMQQVPARHVVGFVPAAGLKSMLNQTTKKKP